MWLELLAEGDKGGAIATAVAAITSRLGKAFGQNMERPIANELYSRLLHIDLHF